MAANPGSYGTAAFGGGDHPQASAMIMQYTGRSDYTADDPPTYVRAGESDGIASWRAMEQRVNALSSMGSTRNFTGIRIWAMALAWEPAQPPKAG